MSITDGRQSIALLGDIMMSRSISVYKEPDYLKMRDMLRSSDVVIGNLEACIHRHFEDPQIQNGGVGSYITMEPALTEDLKWLGVRMVASGSGHADDYGLQGVMDTLRYLDEAGIAHAGSGRHLGEARSPAFFDTASGRVALIAASSQFHSGARAGEQRYDSSGHPGVNGFRYSEYYEADSDTVETLRQIGRTIGWEAEQARKAYQGEPPRANENDYNFLGKKFRVGPGYGVRTEPNKVDLEENTRQIRFARAMADRVVASFHGHELGGESLMTAAKRSEVEDVADFIIEYGRSCIDAGADIFVAHGPQTPMAVELYRNGVILHGLGTFVFQIETMKVLPAEAYERFRLGDRATPADFIKARYKDDTLGHAADPRQWEQAYAVCDFVGDRLAEVRIYPIDLGHARPRSQRGRPIPAKGEVADRILRRIQRLSAKYGTTLSIEGDVGIVRPQ